MTPDDLVLVRRDSGGVFPDGTTNTPAIDFDEAASPATPRPEGPTKADLARAIHEAMPTHNIGGWRMRGAARAVCSSPNDHLADAAAILARLSDTGERPYIAPPMQDWSKPDRDHERP